MKRNPLNKRIFRELRADWARYIVIFLMMTATIGLVSAYLIATDSMTAAYNETAEVYHVEDGHFTVKKELNAAQVRDVQNLGIQIYEDFYLDAELDNDTTMRFFRDRVEVNLVSVWEGRKPEQAGEIGIDRVYANNNDLSIGDRVTTKDGSTSWTITGLIALPDYSALFQNNNDMMFDSVNFGVCILCSEEFDEIDRDEMVKSYSWKYEVAPSDEAEEADKAENLIKKLAALVQLDQFVPRYENQAYTFSGEDIGDDAAMMTILLYILILILGFVFAVTISNTITKEAAVIGTLRASGYARRELLLHYMSTPILVSLVGALVGNALGYTVLKDYMADMYLNSYSLTPYKTLFNAHAFLMTTVIPLLLMFLINWVVLAKTLRLSPLKFLRHDLTRKRSRKSIPLSPRIPFFARFRLRVIFQNLGNYITLVIGILFANFLLLFGMVFPPLIQHYADVMPKTMFCNYQYMLNAPASMADEEHKLNAFFNALQFAQEVETDNPDAEKFSVWSLQTTGEGLAKVEDVTLYGVAEDSRYIDLDLSDGNVYISSAYANKYGIEPGDAISLKEKYEDTEYTFTVDGIYDYSGAIAVFMDQQKLNETFDQEDDYFCGYFSDTEITDIDSAYIASVIDVDSLTKVTTQLMTSMGDLMTIVDVAAVVIFLVVMFLLSKTIIEKNAQNISMTKILGYKGSEISRLYIMATAIVAIAAVILSTPLENAVMKVVVEVALRMMMSGWVEYYAPNYILVEMIILGIGSFLVVAFFEYRRVKKIPMGEALKNTE